MPVSESFQLFAQEQLGGPARVRVRAMFGGVGLYWESAFFGLIDDDVLYLKVDDRTRPSYEARGSKPFDPGKNGEVMKGYYEVPAEVLEDSAQLAEWRDQAIAVARGAKRKPARGDAES